MYQNLHEALLAILGPTIVIIDFIALFVTIFTLIKGCYYLFFVDRLNFQAFAERDTLTAGLLTALEIMLFPETLKLMKVVTLEDIVILVFLIVIHILLTIVLKKDLHTKQGGQKDD